MEGEVEKRYYSNWQYNACAVLNHLVKVVINNDGSLVERTGWGSYNRQYEIHNRTVFEEKRKIQSDMEKAHSIFNKDGVIKDVEKYNRYMNRKGEALDEVYETWPDVFISNITSFVNFEYDGCIYYLEFDSNPFFPFHYMKAEADDSLTIKESYLDEFDKGDWLFDCLITSHTMNDSEYREIANLIFNKLVQAKVTGVVVEKRKIKVPNTYDNGYHNEYLMETRTKTYSVIKYNEFKRVPDEEKMK